ncbi:unannotated protein [freshwater metagenome]|uniref:Unannotated protein n=1 Tax=freshwater metagenome TaxID=449393 RepID=A0A6J7AKK1_9ZZZZ|nr:aminopeptidase N [Actinomycetota bacterium]
MPGVNITQGEAAERSTLLSVQSYEVDLDLTSGAETFIAKTTVRFTGLKVGASTFIDAVGKRVVTATLNGTAIDLSTYDGESVFLPAIAASNELFLEVEGIYSKSGEGLHRFVDPADNEVYLYTQFETGDARRMYACFDQPDLKATFTLSAKTPKHWEVISNYPVANEKVLDANTKYTSFEPTPVISTYVTAIVAGPYHHVHDTYVGKKTIPMGLYCRKSLAPHLDPEEIFTITKQGFAYFESEFGLAYPFAKYDQLSVAEYNWGAMENVGCVTFAEDVFVFRSKVTERNFLGRAGTILHEMAHMWFGDLVTMKWWDNLWLNESFAEWASYDALVGATRYKSAWTEFNSARKNWAYRQDQLSSTHPIAVAMEDLDAVRTNFDGISYAKGASVLQQLVEHVGRENFIGGLQKYFAKHAWGNTVLEDLLSQIEATSGRDLKPWVSTWLQTAGVNTLRPIVEINGDTYTSITVKQEVPTMPADSKQLRPHRLGVGLYDIVNSQLTLRARVELDVAGELTQVTALSGQKVADLVLINDGDLSYAKLRFDDRSIATLNTHLGTLTDPLARALCWASLWDSLRDGELSASYYIPTALKALERESDITMVTTTLLQLDSAAEIFACDKNRESLRTMVANGIEKLLDASKPESDHQLQFARAFAASAATGTQNARVQAMLQGSLRGLTIDADLRWHLINSLVERGLMSKSQIEAELALDNTAHGQRSAAFAIAALPTQETKEASFKAAVAGELTNALHLATLRGFQRPSQRELLAQFVDPYFEMLIELWATKGFELAESTATLLFPIWVINEKTLASAQHWLDVTGKSAPGALRRCVAENRDGLVRALKAQAKDAL